MIVIVFRHELLFKIHILVTVLNVMITYHILKDKGEGLPSVNDVMEGDDIGMLELLQE